MKKKLLPVLVTAILVLGCITPMLTGCDAKQNSVRIVGWNVLNTPGYAAETFPQNTVELRVERTVEIIERYQPDSVGFVECISNWKNALTVNLTDYTIVPTSQTTLNPIYYRADKLELLDCGVFWFSSTPDYPSKEVNPSEERCASWAIFRQKSTNKIYCHINAHVHWDDGSWDDPNQLSTAVIRNKIEEFRKISGYEELGFVVTGDFNMWDMETGYSNMIAPGEVNMQDSHYCAPADKVENEGGTLLSIGNYASDAPDMEALGEQLDKKQKEAVDYIFASIDVLNVQSWKVMRETGDDGFLASDHFGICIDFSFEEGSLVSEYPGRVQQLDALPELEDPYDGDQNEYNIILPTLEHATITCDRTTAKPGELITLNIEVEDGYTFQYDDGTKDGSQGDPWNADIWGMNLLGRALKVNGKSLIWAGNTFEMPAADAKIEAIVVKKPVYQAAKSNIVLDGKKDSGYSDSSEIRTQYKMSGSMNTDNSVAAVSTAYDDEYLYCYAQVTDRTPSSLEELYAVSDQDRSLLCMDSLTFIIDFLNEDDEEVSSADYSFTENESGVFVIDLLNLEKSNSGAVYDRLGCGFAAYNGNTDKADYVLIDNGDGTYEIEIKIALSDSVKQRLSQATDQERPEIGFGIVLQDDKNSNGVYEYEEGLGECQLVENTSINTVWHNLVMVPTDDGHLQPITYDSPRWLSTLVLAAE